MFKTIGINVAAGCRAVARAVPGALVDLVGLGGVGSIAYGAWRVYEPAGFIVGGLLLLAGAIVLGAKASRRAN